MSMSEQPQYIPLAMLNAYAYCPRRFYYEFTLGEMVVNELVLQGQFLHERVDQPGQGSRGNDKLQIRRVYLCAPRLGLVGFCDLVEVALPPATQAGLTQAQNQNQEKSGDGDQFSMKKEVARSEGDLSELARSGQLYPVEYKKGKLGKWLSDHVQLCAQALALEECLDIPAGSIGQGYLFYFGSARRELVAIDQSLREKTLILITQAKEVAAQSHSPLPLTNRAKCQDCSLEEICLPREVLSFEKKRQQFERHQQEEDETET